MANATATYEITVETYTYTATMVTEAGETTATLTGRSDLDCPRRREIKCPGNCKCWYTLHYNINLQAYEPIHCNNCCIALYDIHFVAQPVVATPEPVAVEETAQVQTVEGVVAGIEHYKSVCQAWDDEFDAPYVAPSEKLSDETLELIAADTTPLNLDEPLALEVRPSWMQPKATENATEPDEQDALIAKLAFEADTEVDRQRYFAARSGKYVLLHQRADGLAVNCSCGDRVHRGRRAGRACKHMTAHNAMLAKPAQKATQAA